MKNKQIYKLSGNGNDFVIFENIDQRIARSDYSAIAKTLCKRRLSVGADGLIVVESSAHCDYRMFYYNADGSEGEMCGNGARCLARYCYEKGIAGPVQRIETKSGIVGAERLLDGRYKVRLNNPTAFDLDINMTFAGRAFSCSYVELGDPGLPHAVVEMAGLADMPPQQLVDMAKYIRHYEGFAKGANVNFYDIKGDYIYQLTYERGVEDFTYSCATGTASTVIILAKKKVSSGKAVRVATTGGSLTVDLTVKNQKIEDVFISGGTNIVFIGKVTDSNIG